MPFLRRRGNLASENDMRRHTLVAPAPLPTSASASASVAADTASNSAASTPASASASQDEPLAVSAKSQHPPPPPPSDDAAREALSRTKTNESRARSESRQLRDSCESTQSRSQSPDSPPIQLQSSKHRRFSILRFRNASDSQLSVRAKQQAEKPPPIPRPPAIITTAPTMEIPDGPKKSSSRINLAAKLRRSTEVPRDSDDGTQRTHTKRPMRKSVTDEGGRPSLATLDEPMSPRRSTQTTAAANGTTLNASLQQRQSESSRSDASSIDRVSQSSPNSTPKRSGTPFFNFRRGKKAAEPLFPLAHLPQKDKPPAASSSTSLGVASTPRPATAQNPGTPRTSVADSTSTSQPPPAAAFFAPEGGLSGHSSPTRANLLRGRSSTMSSMGRDSTDDHLLPPTTRTSSSTGRKSFGDLFGLSRLRQNSELSRQGSLTPATPASVTSKSNSLQLPRRGSFILPERRDDESPGKYLARLEDLISRGLIAAALSKGSDPFSAATLRSYMRSFSFFGDPMDMAIRKLLMEAELPKETQHIDRCLQSFANRYHECNPGIYSSPDQAYFVAFSILILHTDVFNKNNKHKMQKTEYLKNTRGEGVCDDVLECFYDNISYTPFIYVEDDLDRGSEVIPGSKSKRKQLLTAAVADPAKRAAKEPIDPYTLILDANLDVLRPNLKDAMQLEDHYNYMGSASSLNLKDLQKTFFRTGILQIVSARSRPDAFMSEKTATNPADAHPGIVDIKITKVGLLWRKEAKKRKTRSPWHEWGAILTGAQLYFFRNTSWVKNLMHQYENHIKAGNDGIPIIFKPPLQEFKPDALMSTHGAAALLDTDYKKHKNAFVYARPNGLDEVLLADNEEELNDWLAKLNYAAAFRTSGVKMRGVVGANYDGQGRRGIRRLDSSDATQLVETPTGLVSIIRGGVDHKMAEDMQSARRDVLQQKIAEGEERVEASQLQLENHLRDARHLQILAPIQPRTREQLLSAAARMSAQLKWTRMEMWKEKCHRDILEQDLAEDVTPASMSTPTKQQSELDKAASPTPRATAIRTDSKASRPDQAPQSPTEHKLKHASSTLETASDLESPITGEFQTPPQSIAESRHESRDVSRTRSDAENQRPGSKSSATAPSLQSPPSKLDQKLDASRDGDDVSAPPRSRDQDDVDADERDFLRQAGLLETRSSRDPSDRATISTTGDAEITVADRDRLDRSKIRRSLQRTLRESAGHLSHHRSKKGKEIAGGRTSEENSRDSMLARGTGSFVVHGKKASVINLGTELQNMSQDEKIMARKLVQQQQQQKEQQREGDNSLSQIQSLGHDEDFHSAVETPPDSTDSGERRESIASGSTATARSFRELHRKYSSARAVRSVSAGRRLAIPSDGESEAALSFSDGRRSPLPPIEYESSDEDGEDENGSASKQKQREDMLEAQKRKAEKDDTDEEQGDDDEDTDEDTDGEGDAKEEAHEVGSLPSRTVQAVNA